MKVEEGVFLYGRAVFKMDGTLVSCECCSPRKIEFKVINSIEPVGFEEAYIPVLNSFEYGDIVRIIGDTHPAIVVTSRDYWKATKERQKQSEFPQNYYSNTLMVEYLYSNGVFSHGHPDIFALEKVEYWDNEKEWKLLQSISNLMKGKGRIEEVFVKCQAHKVDW